MEITSKAKEYRELTQFIKELQDEADALKAAITAEMDARNVDTITADLFTVKLTAYTTSRIDAATLKKELPDIAARYTKTAETRRFQVA